MTRKIISILVALLMVMTLIPISAAAKEDEACSRSGRSVRPGKETVNTRGTLAAYDFETEPTDWTFIDSDGDGFNWQWQGDYSVTPNMTAYHGEGLIYSGSYDKPSGTPLNPDNWAIMPAIGIPQTGAQVSFWAAGQDPSYASEHYAVYAGTLAEIDSMQPIMDETVATGEYTEHVIDLSGFAGQTIYIAFRHFNTYDMFYLDIDLVRIYDGDGPDPLPTDEPLPTPEPTTLPPGVVYGSYFETDQDFDGWNTYDADGDGYVWEVETYHSYEGEQAVTSRSYYGGPLDPDNWLFAPPIVIPDKDARLTFYAENYLSSYPDQIAVFIGEDLESVDDFTQISTMIAPPSYYVQYEVDLSNYAGREAIIAIRHFESYDQFRVMVDQFEVWGSYEIDTVEINGFTAPEYGAEPDNEVSVPEDADYSIQTAQWGFWDDEADAFVPMAEGAVFDDGTLDYCQQFTVVPNSSYAFAEELSVLINDDSSNAGSFGWDADLGAEVIYSAIFNVDEPVDYSLDEALNAEGGELHFETSEDYPWYTVEDEGTGRIYAMSGNAGVNSSSSSVWTTVEAAVGERLVFDFKAWGEGTTYDVCKLYVDGTQIFSYGARQNDWESFTYAFPSSGEHTITWTYSKDWLVDPRGDYFALDEVRIEDAVIPDSITVEPMVIYTGLSANAVYTVSPEEACQYVVFAMEDDSIASVDENGKITAIAEGASTLTVTSAVDDSVYGTALITVEIPPDLDAALNVEGGTLHFETSENYPWYVTNFDENGRIYALSGNAGVKNSVSSVWTTVEAGMGDVLSFDFKAWGDSWLYDDEEEFYDKCDFLINGALIFRYGRYDNDWENFTYVFPEAGEYTLTWSYSKNNYTDPPGDYFALDEVSFTEAVVPDSITVEPVEVGVNGMRMAVYSIAPENACQFVTFSVENTNIASVNQDGNILGKTVGVTYLTVASALDGSVYGTAEITVTEPQEPYFYGFTYTDYSNKIFWTCFPGSDPTSVIWCGDGGYTFAGAYYDGLVYGFTNNGFRYFTMDPDTFEMTITDTTAPYQVLSLAYNYTNDTMYAIMYQYGFDTQTGYIMTVDLETGELTEVAEITGMNGRAYTFAIDNEGNGYAINREGDGYSIDDSRANLYGIDLETGEATLIGETGLAICFIQSMTWDMNTNRLFWAQYYDNGNEGLYEVDPETAEVTALGTIGDGTFEVCCLYTRYDPNPTEPEVIESVDILDFEVPAWGEEPFRGVTVPEDAHYSIVFNDWYWYTEDDDCQMGADELFDNEDCLYYQFFRLIPDEGYTFSEDTVVTIDGSDEYVASAEFDPVTGRLHVETTDFTVYDPAIRKVCVNGWGSPESGVAGVDHVFLETPEDAHYFIIYAGWLDETDEQQLWSEDHVFIPGHMYSEGVQIWAEEGYYFAEDCEFYTDDGEDILDAKFCYVDEELDWICYMNSIPEMCIEEISEFFVDGYEFPPIAGHNSEDQLDLTVPEGAPYYIDFDWTSWYDEDAMMDFSGPFEAGVYYSVATVIQLPEGYVFGEEVSICLNGDTELLSEYVYVYEDHLLFYTVPFLCRMWGDANGDNLLDTADVLLIMRYSLGLEELDEFDIDPWCDVNGDGAWDFSDALLILRKVMGIIEWFPIEV